MAETRRLQQVQSELQTARLARMQQIKDATQQQNQQRLHTAQTAHLQQIARHQHAWMAVHERLQDMAEGGLRLSRLHSDAGLVAMHGELNRFEAMALAQQSLSEHLGQAIALKEVSSGPASQVRFVWQTNWPALHSAQTVANSGKAKP
jgi:prephenate dehydratase